MEELAEQRCPTHPAAPSVATCIRCGRFLCVECRYFEAPPLCADCHPLWTDPLGVRRAPFEIGSAIRNGMRMLLPVIRPVLLLTLVTSIPGGLLAVAAASDATGKGASQLRLSNLYDGLIGIICTVACVALFIGVAEGRRLGTWEAVKESTSRWGRVFGTNFRAGLWIGFLTLALLVPGVWKLVMLAFTTPAAIRLRRDDPLEVSSALVKGRWWAACGALLVTGLVAYSPAAAVTFLLGAAPPLANSAPDSPASIGFHIFENWAFRFSEQVAASFSLAMFYALVNTTGFTLGALHWRRDL